ncbi:MAG: adenylosuccinate synthase [Candidatus Izemoplasmatales bacterium]|nr:adenylosuccinate synthase [Candidatus Izemoplasmatales bacterium]MDD3865477.1 adenylosuccinate synthase [Candidatus Izemoplasmatales bacterium]
MGKRIVVVGTQWGDEGKGKITDYLALDADVVVRSQGGNNAGHTINFNNQKFALHFIPSGVFNPQTKNIMANGMVIEPIALFREIDELASRGITNYQLYISDRAHCIMPYHLELDSLWEDIKGSSAVGTTKKGIGPAYADKASRIGIRLADLLDPESLMDGLKTGLAMTNPILECFHHQTYDLQDLYQKYLSFGKRLKPYITDTSVLLNAEIEKGSKILFEGAQGIMLCVEHGTYPYVTSSSPTAASVPMNCGISPMAITDVIGITKAYTTRVGSGSFPTEFEDDTAKYIREKGHEYGTTTGRPRRIGWLDTVALRHAKRVSGITELSVMLLDVLTGIPQIKICTQYELDGEIIDRVPSNYRQFSQCKPVYVTLPGWKENITNIHRFDELPINAQNYLKAIENYTGLPIAIFSIGPDRTQTIALKAFFK